MTRRSFRIVILSPEGDRAWLAGAIESQGWPVRQFPFPHAPARLGPLARRFASARPDAVVYDLDAPSSTHVDVYRRIRALPSVRDVPSLVLTSEPEVLHRLLGPMAVYDVLLETPCAPVVIVRALDLLINERRHGLADGS